ncbi:MAG: hypothetical protein J6A73_04750 [Lachnospiraceae bacterium]|nr:hypothetical protein [Lachnospiraceae bacterium]
MFGLIVKGATLVASVASKVVGAVSTLVYPLVSTVATTDGGASTIDSGIIEELLNLCKQVMTLFTEFPLNVFLVASLVGIGFGIFKSAKRAAKHG